MQKADLLKLKVPELKAILQKTGLPQTGKKDDLIARILASSAASVGDTAVVAISDSAPVDDDLLAPPEEFDWGANVGAGGTLKPPSSKPPPAHSEKTDAVQKSSGTPAVAPPNPAPGATAANTSIATVSEAVSSVAIDDDDEMFKRKARAARFGIPLVESKPPAPKVKAAPAGPKAPPKDVDTKKAARAARFNQTPPTGPASRTTHAQPGAAKATPALLDPEEEAKKRKRAERFGLVKPEAEGPEAKKTKA